jgi:hypothetical protein
MQTTIRSWMMNRPSQALASTAQIRYTVLTGRRHAALQLALKATLT